MGPTIDWVVLTTGDRDDDLVAALNSLATHLQPGERVHLVLNGAGLTPPGPLRLEHAVADALHVIHAGENLGIPGGRNVGAAASEADVVAFLDDDAVVRSDDMGRQLRDRFAADARLGGVSFRIVDPNSGATAQRHVPRPGGAGLEREGEVTSFLGGASALSGPMFRSVGGYCAEFFYAHEESDLAWRAVGSGWRFTYAVIGGDPPDVAHHPPSRRDRTVDAQPGLARPSQPAAERGDAPPDGVDGHRRREIPVGGGPRIDCRRPARRLVRGPAFASPSELRPTVANRLAADPSRPAPNFVALVGTGGSHRPWGGASRFNYPLRCRRAVKGTT